MKTILLIEDEKDIRENVAKFLQINNYNVFDVSNGKEAIKIVLKQKPDLIISDIMMPGIDGFYVKQKLDKEKAILDVPFIFLTAKSDLEDIREGMNLGADDYITKPFKMKDLLLAVQTRLNRFENVKKEAPNGDKNHKKNSSKIFVSEGKNPALLDTNEIVYISSEGEYTNVILANGKKYFLRKLLKIWEMELPAKDFFRIHRSVLVNLNKVTKIRKIDLRNFEVFVENIDYPLKISQRSAVKMKRALGV